MFWHELPNYNPQGVQLSEPGSMRASDAAALFATLGDKDEDIGDDEDGEGAQDELDVDQWDSRGGVDEGDQDAMLIRYLLLKKEFY